jgi:hypothetical protein
MVGLKSKMVERSGTALTKSGKIVATYLVPCPKCGRIRVIKRETHAKQHAEKLCKWCSNKNNHPQGEHQGLRISWWKKYQLSAKSRGLAWELTIDDGVELYRQQDGKCALTGVPITCAGDFTNGITASIDRIDNAKGYVPGNVQLVHKEVNMMRGTLSVPRFLELCKAVADKVKW